MARLTTEFTIPEHKIEKQYSMACDICGLIEETGNDDWCGDEDWTSMRTKLSIEKRVDYGRSGGESETQSYDICPACMEDTVFPFIIMQGGRNPHKSKRDW